MPGELGGDRAVTRGAEQRAGAGRTGDLGGGAWAGPSADSWLRPQGPEAEVELVKGSQVLVTVDPAFRTRGDAGTVWVDYPNIVRVVPVGGHIYIDDGLISLAVKKIGADAPPAPPRALLRALSAAPAFALRPSAALPAGVPPRASQEPPTSTLPGPPGLGGESFLPQASAWCPCSAGPRPGAEKPRGRGSGSLGGPTPCSLGCDSASGLAPDLGLLSPCPQAQRGWKRR